MTYYLKLPVAALWIAGIYVSGFFEAIGLFIAFVILQPEKHSPPRTTLN